MKPYDLVAYAADFTSFLITRIDMSVVRSIILFGSVARLEAGRDSDVDLFIDVTSKEDTLQAAADRAKDEFFDSIHYRNYWKLLGVENEISVLAGKLAGWDLEKSIAVNGITLYGKYAVPAAGGRHAVLFSWENVKPESRRAALNKKLFGYAAGKKTYPGLLQVAAGTKIGKCCILVDAGFAAQTLRLFRQLKVTVRIRHITEHA